jgi:hypothetical protein
MIFRKLAALVVGALLVAGCSSSGDDGSAGATSSARDGAVRFAACMRDNGVRDFPDPDASGDLTLDGVVNGSSLDPDSATWKTAVAACKELEPAGFTGGRRSPEQQTAALTFAACMREHGVRDFPDPVNGEPLIDTNKIPSSAEPGGMDILDGAADQCHDAAEAAMAER